jgi:hypothetical protein
LFAISYDLVEGLAAFAAKHGVTYPLLSDAGSRVIRELGLLNEQVFEQHAAYNVARNEEHYGVPYPGVFVLDENGVVADKRFYASYRERETGVGLLEDAVRVASPRHGAEDAAGSGAVRVHAYLDSPTFVYYQRLRLTVEVAIAPGFHVYGEPVPAGYVPLAIEVGPIDGLIVGEVRWPTPHPFTIAGLDENFCVYDGTVRVSAPVTFVLPPISGDQAIPVQVTYQACDATSCLAPSRVTLSLSVEETGLIDRPLRRQG